MRIWKILNKNVRVSVDLPWNITRILSTTAIRKSVPQTRGNNSAMFLSHGSFLSLLLSRAQRFTVQQNNKAF